MVITDLKETCAQCRGTGRQPGISVVGIPQINIGGVCPQCGGRGFRLTELGQDVLRMLRPFIEDIIDERLRRHETEQHPPQADEEEDEEPSGSGHRRP